MGSHSGLLCQGVRRCADDLQFVLAADVAHERGQARIALDETEVEIALGDPVLHDLGVGNKELRHDGRIAGLELTEHLRQHEFSDCRARADEQRPRHLTAQLLQTGIELVG